MLSLGIIISVKICISVAAILNLAIQKFLKGDKVQ